MKQLVLQLAFLLASAAAAPSDSAVPPPELEVYFEIKLLVRERVRGRPVQVDQWSGGRVRMVGKRTSDGGMVYRIAEILESPWTFRWYPLKDEVKLGAAVWVEHPEGHPYGALAPRLEARARSKFELWWDADPAVPGPSWSDESGRFWARRHADELDRKDPLPEHPTYPFHVLGPLDDRFGFTLRDGAVESIVERMSGPWLPNGWSEARDGEPVEGYGFWERKRPRWEPRTYETFAAALALLGSPGSDSADPTDGLMGVLSAMQPIAARLGRGELRDPLEWRNREEGSDEVQILVQDRDLDAFKAWVRVGYRAVPPQTP
jgi:hypothetical protein